jgi:hypothetical protein
MDKNKHYIDPTLIQIKYLPHNPELVPVLWEILHELHEFIILAKCVVSLNPYPLLHAICDG